MEHRHTAREFDGELADLRDRLLLMGARVEKAAALAVEAVESRSAALGRQVMAGSDQVEQLEIEIEEMGLRILALRHPVASDLRFVTTTLKIVTELARIGNLCVSMANLATEIRAEPRLALQTSLGKMGDDVRGMLRDALDAFVDRDAAKASQIPERDRHIDAAYGALLTELFRHMRADTESVLRATRLQAMGKSIERIGDHATSIADMVYFMIEGRRIRRT